MTVPAQPSTWRSLLFAPGAEPRKLERASSAGADAVIYDLEDAVVPALKDAARRLVMDALAAGAGQAGARLVRVNALDTPWAQEDLAAVARSGAHGVLLPKCESAAQLALAQAALGERAGAPKLIALIETPAGVLDLAALSGGPAALAGLAFGHADFCQAMGLSSLRSDTGVAWHARMQVVVAARARRLAAYDCVCLAVHDAAAFEADAALGRDLGYDGKLCIHPAQVALANAAYTPQPDAVARARRVLDAWAQAQHDGLGVIAVDGMMVDAPVAAAAQRVLDRAGASADATQQGVS